MTPSTDPAAKPRFAYAIATVLGTGYLKPGPGTWGSAVGLLIAIVSHPFTWFLLLGKGIEVAAGKTAPLLTGFGGTLLLLVPSIAVWLFLALLGVKTSRQVAEFAGVKDPQYVVIDEVSGVHLSLILSLAPVTPMVFLRPEDAAAFALYSGMSILNWKFLLAGFLLFRLFDILKPFPCRRLEKLPGGWGIMADDWMAGVYAAICLRLALHFHWL
ncbi:MAG TPA: phosphatidylglycerophosphatase A [Candidatus Sulfotelmatobacter sp.]|jgi:phosphatidylglycerophosphatase A|nr:phosphatidylglycerophosphatase A [Candidatus Sulfotelmatobacter sp.]